MSWFTKKIEHPALNALASLVNHPAIQNNPEALAAVQQVKDDATQIAATVTNAAQTVAAQVQADVDPILASLAGGVQTALDSALLAYLGPVGVILTPAANTGLTLMEKYLHDHIAAMFHTVKSSAPTA